MYPLVGTAVVIAAALNGIAILHAYFRVFTGTRHAVSISLRARLSERIAVLILMALIIGGGLFPQPGVSSRYHAAEALMKQREAVKAPPPLLTEAAGALEHAHAPDSPTASEHAGGDLDPVATNLTPEN